MKIKLKNIAAGSVLAIALTMGVTANAKDMEKQVAPAGAMEETALLASALNAVPGEAKHVRFVDIDGTVMAMVRVKTDDSMMLVELDPTTGAVVDTLDRDEAHAKFGDKMQGKRGDHGKRGENGDQTPTAENNS